MINATGEGLKREGRAKKLGIPKPLRAIRLKCLDSGKYVSMIAKYKARV